MQHQIIRVRHELRRRSLNVQVVEHVTPGMVRIWLTGKDLVYFDSPGADDHIKLFVPASNGATERRDYTPRRFDRASRALAIDFAMHEAGPATDWARHARVGDTVEIGGQRGSVIVPHDFDWWLLIGDETALPAIGRRIEELPAGTPATSLVAVAGPEEEQHFVTDADHESRRVHRPLDRAHNPAPLLDALERLVLPPGDGFIWIAGEAGVARALRGHVLETLRHRPAWLKASGYWVTGRADAHEKLER